MLVYDITSHQSLENARSWKEEIENNVDDTVLVYLVGNRADLGDTDQREVTQEMAVEMMNELDCDHCMETSALTGFNINECFETLTKNLYYLNKENLDDFAAGGGGDNEGHGGKR